MAKSKENTSITVITPKGAVTKVVPTAVVNGNLVPDDHSPELGVKS